MEYYSNPNSAQSAVYQQQYQTGWWNQLTGGRKEKAANVAMAEIDRRYQSKEAQKLRDWQQMMSNSAYQRQVADMKAAGINPALLFAGKGNMSGASVPSGASGSGSRSQNPAASTGQLAGLIGTVIGSTAFAVSKAASAATAAKTSKFIAASRAGKYNNKLVRSLPSLWK